MPTRYCGRWSDAQLPGSGNRDRRRCCSCTGGLDQAVYFDEVVGRARSERAAGHHVGFPRPRRLGKSRGAVRSQTDCQRRLGSCRCRRREPDVVLVGFSMSGKFAQYVATCRPERVSGLVLVAGFQASEIPFPQEVIRDWVARAGDRERMRELLSPHSSASPSTRPSSIASWTTP